MHVFKVIGNLCGGFMEVDKSTVEMKDVSIARLKVVGKPTGFIP